MGYPPQMKKLIGEVEKTRPKRLGQTIPLLPLEEQEDLLKKYHPDYRDGVRRRISVGPNKGDFACNELVDLLESKCRIDPPRFDLSPKLSVDVLVVGGGGGGAAAALTAHDNGAKVLLVTKLRLGDSNTIMAEGGMNAATSPDDSPVKHYIDTMGGGHFTNNPQIVKALVLDAPKIVGWFENLGVAFTKNADGTLEGTWAGGASYPRIHFVADYTGMEIMKVLRDEIFNRRIPYLEFSPVIELILDEEGKCAGAMAFDLETNRIFPIRAKSVILATGGIGRLHIQNFPTTNHYGATADGLVVAYRAGVKLLYMDSIQFHPTTVAYPEQISGLLVTEVFRGRGVHLVNRKGERFINELETRDVVASAIIREVNERGLGVSTPSGMKGVWLDTPLIEMTLGLGSMEKFFTHLLHRFNKFDIDIRKEPILVYPGQHYQNGGLLADDYGETNVPNLYAVGEVAGGVHGRNRLGGNSLIDLFVFGRRAGENAAQKAKRIHLGKLTLRHVEDFHRALKEQGIEKNAISPILLPDYRYEKALQKIQL